VLLLPHASEIGCTLAGGCLLVEDKHVDTEEMILDAAILRVQSGIRGARHVLMAGQDTWQPNTRIARYHGLWKYLAKLSAIPAGERSEELLIESSEGIRFFGYIESCEHSVSELVRMLRAVRTCTLIALSPSVPSKAITDLLHRGWHQEGVAPPLDLLRAACVHELVIYSPLGFFDDRERGFAMIGRPQILGTVFD
jgi:hypothetical protein